MTRKGGIYFGIPPKDLLPPPGFEFVVKHEEWLLARCLETGKEYYVFTDDKRVTRLALCKVATEKDVRRTQRLERPFQEGDRFMDEPEAVVFQESLADEPAGEAGLDAWHRVNDKPESQK